MTTERAIKLDTIADIFRSAKDRLLRADRTMLTVGDHETIEAVVKAMDGFMEYATRQIDRENMEE